MFVNEIKAARAKEILNFWKITPKNDDDLELKERFSGHLNDAGLKPEDDEALEFVYRKLGGLVWTEEEHTAHKVKVEKIKSKNKKK